MLAGIRRSATEALTISPASGSSASPIQWACILRNETLLVDAATVFESGGIDEVTEVARNLLNKGTSPGWEFYTPNFLRRKSFSGSKGLKFHVYEEGNNSELLIWTFACVYDSRRLGCDKAKAFIEQKLVGITQVFREVDLTWRLGGYQACQQVFRPILQQRIDEMGYSGVSLVDDNLELSKEIIGSNKQLLHERHILAKHREQNVNGSLLAYWKPVDRKISPAKSADTSIDMTEEESTDEGDLSGGDPFVTKVVEVSDDESPVCVDVSVRNGEIFSLSDASDDPHRDGLAIHEENEEAVTKTVKFFVDEDDDDAFFRSFESDIFLEEVLEATKESNSVSQELEEILRIADEISMRRVKDSDRDHAPRKKIDGIFAKIQAVGHIAQDEVSILTDVKDERPCFLCTLFTSPKSNLVQ